jgi:transposase InsO family protein
MSTIQNNRLVMDTVREALRKEKVAVDLQLHSDQGFQYTSNEYYRLTKENGITPSMSRRGNPYDNAMAENFFSILKTECTRRTKYATFNDAKEDIEAYIYFYNNERIQAKTTWMPPVKYRMTSMG